MSKPKTARASTGAPGKKTKPAASRTSRSKGAAKRSAGRRNALAAAVARVVPATGPAPAAPVEAAEPAAVASKADPFYLNLEPSCTLREGADMQFSLIAARGDPVVVDGSAVERIDTAGLQLLVALARREQDSGRKLEWKAASTSLVSSSVRLGLVDVLGLGALASEVTP